MDRVVISDLSISIADGVLEGVRAVADAISDLHSEIEGQGAPDGYQLIRQRLLYRTAERLYCSRLAVIASMAPLEMPSGGQLVVLAAHCWHAAEVLADMDPQHPARLAGAATITGPAAEAGVPAPSGDTTITATPQGADTAALDGDARDW